MTRDPSHFVHHLFAIGTIADIDHDKSLLRVSLGEITTDWLPFPAEIGRNFIRWRPLREDTQVVLACPAGDPSQGLIVQMVHHDKQPAPSDNPDLDVIVFDDGTTMTYDSSASALKLSGAGNISINSKADIAITSAGTLSLAASAITIAGPVQQTGGDITSDGISAQTHTHPTPVGASGAPQ